MMLRQISQYFAIVCLLFVFSCSTLFAQKKKAASFPEGVITYKMTAKGTQFEGAEQFINNSSLQVYIKNKSTCLDLAIMNGLVRMKLVYNSITDKSFLLLDIPFIEDGKVALTIDKDEIQKMLPSGEMQEANPDDIKKMIKFKGSKKIAKHNCKKGSLELPAEAKDVKFDFYVSKKLTINADNFDKFIDIFGGFPLGFDIAAQGNELSIYATEIEKKTIADSNFNIPSNYKEKSLEEFKSLFEDKINEKVIGL